MTTRPDVNLTLFITATPIDYLRRWGNNPDTLRSSLADHIQANGVPLRLTTLDVSPGDEIGLHITGRAVATATDFEEEWGDDDMPALVADVQYALRALPLLVVDVDADPAEEENGAVGIGAPTR